MTNDKQTTVDWIFSQLPYEYTSTRSGFDVYQMAKEMEKERIIKAYDEDLYGGLSGNRKFKDGKEYYEFTYGGNK